MDLFLIRHAQKELKEHRHTNQTNMSLDLTATGLNQAKETAYFISNYLKTHNISERTPIKIWNSPYHRTRITSEIIKNNLKKNNIPFIDEESIYLSEFQLGLIDTTDNYQQEFPHEANHFSLHEKHNHSFFARAPLGESVFDVYQRIKFFINHYLNDDCFHIIVSHGTPLALFSLIFNNQPFDTFNLYEFPSNSSIHYVKNNQYFNEIFKPTVVTE